MRKIKILILLSSLVMNCSKKTQPAPEEQQSVNNTTTQSTLNSQENTIKGAWDLVEKLVYINGTAQPSLTVNYTSPFYYISLDSNDVVPQNGTWKQAVNSIKGNAIITQWKATIDTLMLGSSNFRISGVTTTSLVLQQGNFSTDTSYVYNFGR